MLWSFFCSCNYVLFICSCCFCLPFWAELTSGSDSSTVIYSQSYHFSFKVIFLSFSPLIKENKTKKMKILSHQKDGIGKYRIRSGRVVARLKWGLRPCPQKCLKKKYLEALKRFTIFHEVFLEKNQSSSTGDYFPN